MLSLGNEMGGDTAAMAKLVKHLHEIDAAAPLCPGLEQLLLETKLAPGDDYWTTVRTRSIAAR